LPDKASIAVLPFQNFADGLAQQAEAHAFDRFAF